MSTVLTILRPVALAAALLVGVAPLAAQDLPAPDTTLEAGTASYVVTIEMNGQQMQMNVTHEVETVEEGWRVTEVAEGPMGTATDVEVLQQEALTPISRTVTQGPMNIELTYSDTTVTGTILMQGNEQPVDVDLDGPIYSDGAGANLVIAALPLEEGYSAEYRTLDLMQQQPRAMQVEVVGTESVTVPAGTFDTYRVEISSTEGGEGGTTLWVDQESRLVVMAVASVPQLNGATLTSELERATRLEE